MHSFVSSKSPPSTRQNVRAGHAVWAVLFGRTGLFIAFQAAFALGFLLAGRAGAWNAAAGWWPFSVTFTNLFCLFWLGRLFRREGALFWEIFRIRRVHLKGDLLVLVALMFIAGPVGFFPNIWLGSALFRDPTESLTMLLHPLPVWAAYASIVFFPVTQGLVELPLYFMYVMPRLQAGGMARPAAIGLAALMLGLQHLAIPLMFDWRFIAWRAMMYLPFALLLGVVLNWRPRLLPYLAAIHVLMDLSFAMMLLPYAY